MANVETELRMMSPDVYAPIVGDAEIRLLKRIASRLEGRSFLHVNSTSSGGGVAEILHRMIPLLRGMGVAARWEVITAAGDFFDVTKVFHNGLQGKRGAVTLPMKEIYQDVNDKNAAEMDLSDEFVLIHDPQPAALIRHRPGGGRWIWRCHVDISHPDPEVWNFLKPYVEAYQASIFSMPRFAQTLPIPQYMAVPSIDPLSEKNRDLSDEEITQILKAMGLERDKPLLVQISRFDRFKDPVGVLEAYRIVKRYTDCALILAGGGASDDPEGERVLSEVRERAKGDPDVHILLLPPFADREVNALQRAATIVLQKSTREGFGLTVAEALWKGKPVIGGAVGGIPLQIIDGWNGYLVHSIEGAAFRLRSLLRNSRLCEEMGRRGREHVRKHFLITRHIRDYLCVLHATLDPGRRVMEI